MNQRSTKEAVAVVEDKNGKSVVRTLAALALLKPPVAVAVKAEQEVPPAAKADASAAAPQDASDVKLAADREEAARLIAAALLSKPSEPVGAAKPQGDAKSAEGGEGRKHRRRRDRKNAAGAGAGASTAPANGEVVGDQSTATTPPPVPQQTPQVRALQSGGRKIELVQIAPKREDPPKGTIHLRDFLRVVHPRQLLGIAKGITESGATPDVVIWARSKSGSIDHVRIEVVSKELKGRDGPVTVPNLKITEAKGTLQAFVPYIEKDVPEEYRKFENFAQYIGQDIRFVEARNLPGKDGRPRIIPGNAERAMRTVTLCALFEASGIHFKAENAKWKARRRPTARKEAPAAVEQKAEQQQ